MDSKEITDATFNLKDVIELAMVLVAIVTAFAKSKSDIKVLEGKHEALEKRFEETEKVLFKKMDEMQKTIGQVNGTVQFIAGQLAPKDK